MYVSAEIYFWFLYSSVLLTFYDLQFFFIFYSLTRMQSYISTWRSKGNPAGHGAVSADPNTGIHLFESYYTKVGNFFGSSQKLQTGNPKDSNKNTCEPR